MHKKEHHHRAHEMEHHKMREHHKKAHHAKHEAMIDNRKVSDNHQQGIERVKQRHGDMEVGQHGKMGMHKHGDSFKRHGGGHTPVRG